MEANETSLNSEHRFKDGMAKNAARIPKAKWDEHKELLCSLYHQMTISEILVFMWAEHDFVVNAGQLGRKLREWGMYKYRSKNQPLNLAWPASENFNTPDPFPVILHDEIVQDQPLQQVSATDAGIPVLPIPHSNPFADADSKILQTDQATAKTDTGMDFCLCVNSVIEAYRDAISLVDLIQRKKEPTEIKSLLDTSHLGFHHSLANGLWVIRSHYRRDSERFGKEYGRGDSRAQEKMDSILATFQSTIISNLQRVETETTPSFNYKALQSASDKNTAGALACLGALSHRLSIAAAGSNELSEYNMPYPMGSDWMPETLACSEGWPRTVPKSSGDWAGFSSTHESQPHDRSASPIVPAISIVNKEPENGGISDIDMDRLSEMSLAPSSLNSFSSFRSLARRIRLGEIGMWSSDRYSMDDSPPNSIHWNRSNGSFELFGQLSSRLSIASSQKTDSSKMSWRPEIPATIDEDDGAMSEGLRARFRWRKRVHTPTTAPPLHIEHVTHESTKGLGETRPGVGLIMAQASKPINPSEPPTVIKEFEIRRPIASEIYSKGLEDKPVRIFSYNYMLFGRSLDEHVEPEADDGPRTTGGNEATK